jgi:hypothetical protein
MTRLMSLAGLACAAAGLAGAGCIPREGGRVMLAEPTEPSARPSVEAARELDQQGIRSFRAGRYVDAVEYFRAAYRLGGPSSELWNIVRCREGLDDAEGAAAAIGDYLSSKDVTAQDRTDAEREAQGLRSRLSMLTVTTTPSGASVSVDGKAVAGSTPLSVELRAGSHTLVARRDGYSPVTRSIDARFGRAVIMTLDLERAAK